MLDFAYKLGAARAAAEFEKNAGGPARTLKSYRRVIQRMSDHIADKTGQNADDVFRGLYSQPLNRASRKSFPVTGNWESKRPACHYCTAARARAELEPRILTGHTFNAGWLTRR